MPLTDKFPLFLEKNIVVQAPNAVITHRTDGILQIEYANAYFTIHDNREIFSITRQTCPWEIAPVYLKGGGFTNTDAESRAFNGSNEVTKHCSAIAFLSPSLGQKILATFFIKVIRPKTPTRFFNDEQGAIKWLRKFPTTPKRK